MKTAIKCLNIMFPTLPTSFPCWNRKNPFYLFWPNWKNNQIWPFEIKNCGGSEDHSDAWGGSVKCVNSQSFLVRGPSNHKHYYILGPGESIYKTQLTYGNIKSVLQTIISMLIVCMRWKNNSLKVNIFHIVIQWNQWNWESLAWFN